MSTEILKMEDKRFQDSLWNNLPTVTTFDKGTVQYFQVYTFII
jgi:hypothetical protein